MPRPRFTIRRMMIAVAIVGLTMGAELTRRRWVHHRRLAEHYAVAEQLYRGQAKEIEEAIDGGRTGLGPALERRRAMAETALRLRRNWERAARYPWLPVVPDPPEPK